MAKLKKTISLRNCFIDHADVGTIQEIGKDETLFYNVYDLLMEFADREGVSITISTDSELPSAPDEGADDE